VTGSQRKLHNEEHHNLNCSTSIIRIIKSRRMRWAGDIVCMIEMRNENKILVGKPKRKIPPRRPKHKWEDNIKTDLGKIWLEGVYWIHLTQDRNWWQALVNMVMNLHVHKRLGI
jgi:hypothetical protein